MIITAYAVVMIPFQCVFNKKKQKFDFEYFPLLIGHLNIQMILIDFKKNI